MTKAAVVRRPWRGIAAARGLAAAARGLAAGARGFAAARRCSIIRSFALIDMAPNSRTWPNVLIYAT